MTLVGADRLEAYRKLHPESDSGLTRWRKIVQQSSFDGTQDFKRTFGKSYDYVRPRCHVFDIAHGRHRLIALVDFPSGIVSIADLMDHKRYDRWRCS